MPPPQREKPMPKKNEDFSAFKSALKTILGVSKEEIVKAEADEKLAKEARKAKGSDAAVSPPRSEG